MPLIQGGFILQPRSWDRSDAAHFPPVVRELWHYLLRNVSYKDTEISRRGSRWFTLDEIQKSLSWRVGYRVMTYSKPQLTKALRKLRDEQMISRNDDPRNHREGNNEGFSKETVKTTAKATHGVFVSIINYDFYQTPENYESNDDGNRERLAKATRRKSKGNANKNGKNERMEEEIDSSLPKGLLLSPFHDEAYGFADWFIKELKPESVKVTDKVRNDWALVWHHLRHTDGRSTKSDKEAMKMAIAWARKDPFWSKNFLTPMKLRKKDREGLMYIDRFLELAKTTNGSTSSNRTLAQEIPQFRQMKPLSMED